MREILFRGKRMDNGEWAYGWFIPDMIEAFQNDPDLCDWGFIKQFGKTKEECLMVEVERDTVGQYTGLTDKNGNKIFNGDILSFVNHYQNAERAWKCVVEYDNNAAAFVCVYIDRFGDERIYNHFDSWNVPLVEWEVIGNRWDNPELLKDTD